MSKREYINDGFMVMYADFLKDVKNKDSSHRYITYGELTGYMMMMLRVGYLDFAIYAELRDLFSHMLFK